MQSSISATEAVRHFSELLNNIRYRGDRYTVIRGGKPAAVLAPVETILAGRTLGELRDVISSLPRLDPQDASFADDVMAAVHSQPAVPEKSAWE